MAQQQVSCESTCTCQCVNLLSCIECLTFHRLTYECTCVPYCSSECRSKAATALCERRVDAITIHLHPEPPRNRHRPSPGARTRTHAPSASTHPKSSQCCPLNPEPQTPNPKPQTLARQELREKLSKPFDGVEDGSVATLQGAQDEVNPQTLNPEPQTPNPKHKIPDPKFQAPKLKPQSVTGPRGSTPQTIKPLHPINPKP